MKAVEILEGNKIKVNTPNPYIVDSYEHAEPEKIEDVVYNLKQSVLFLRNCLKVLGISNKEAYLKGYTLNIHTGEELQRIARNYKGLSHEFYMLILKHEW